MRNTLKVAVSITLALGLGGALAYAQPLISGNTAAFGCGPIATSDFTQGIVVQQFVPDGAHRTATCPKPDPLAPPYYNGRGLAIGGTEVFYTELDEIPGPDPGFGGSEFIHVADYNAGAGSGDTRLLLNPDTRPGNGIQDLTFANGVLYMMSGYDQLTPQVRGLNLSTGVVLSGPVSPAFPTSPDSDGFAVLPNGNFLINNGGTSCIYSQYNPTTGAFVAGSTLNVPGNFAVCTGVDTDGTSLYFMVDFNGILRTDFAGNPTGFKFWDGPDGENFIIDISLVHPVTSIISTGDGHLFFALRNTDDINSKFDIRAEVMKNGTVVADGLTRCAVINRRAIPGNNIPVPIGLPTAVPLASGDVISVRISVRMGTNPDDTQCPGHFSANGGLRFFYDSTRTPSQFDMTIQPSPASTFYFHSDGTTCTDVLGESQPTATLDRTLSDVAPTTLPVRCKEVASNITFAGGNPWNVFSTWSLAPLP